MTRKCWIWMMEANILRLTPTVIRALETNITWIASLRGANHSSVFVFVNGPP